MKLTMMFHGNEYQEAEDDTTKDDTVDTMSTSHGTHIASWATLSKTFMRTGYVSNRAYEDAQKPSKLARSRFSEKRRKNHVQRHIVPLHKHWMPSKGKLW